MSEVYVPYRVEREIEHQLNDANERDRRRRRRIVHLPDDIEQWMRDLGLQVPVRIPARAPKNWTPSWPARPFIPPRGGDAIT